MSFLKCPEFFDTRQNSMISVVILKKFIRKCVEKQRAKWEPYCECYLCGDDIETNMHYCFSCLKGMAKSKTNLF